MILFQDRASDVQVMRTKGDELGVDKIGVLRQPDTGMGSPNWIWDIGRIDKAEFILLERSEKVDIIGMLDKLNNFGYRSIGTTAARWREITGLPEATF